MRLFILLAIVFLVSCAETTTEDRKNGYSETAKNAEDSLYQQVIDLHDEAMAKTRKITGYLRQFDAKIDSLKKVKSPTKESLTRKYTEISNDLKVADEKMEVWMKEFRIDSAQDDTKRRMEYLESEKSKVSKVRDDILSALSKADSALKN